MIWSKDLIDKRDVYHLHLGLHLHISDDLNFPSIRRIHWFRQQYLMQVSLIEMHIDYNRNKFWSH